MNEKKVVSTSVTVLLALLCTLWIIPLFISSQIVFDLLEELNIFLSKNDWPDGELPFSGIEMLAKPFFSWSLILLGVSSFIWSLLLFSIHKKLKGRL